MTTTSAVARASVRTVREWLRHVEGPTLYLPWGWFGRPYDNSHTLTGSILSPHQIVLEFDRDLLVVVSGVVSIDVDASHERDGGPSSSPDWTTMAIGGSVVTVVWSEDEFPAGGDVRSQSARDSQVVLVAPRPGTP